jgi:hypothetical protein
VGDATGFINIYAQETGLAGATYLDFENFDPRTSGGPLTQFGDFGEEFGFFDGRHRGRPKAKIQSNKKVGFSPTFPFDATSLLDHLRRLDAISAPERGNWAERAPQKRLSPQLEAAEPSMLGLHAPPGGGFRHRRGQKRSESGERVRVLGEIVGKNARESLGGLHFELLFVQICDGHCHFILFRFALLFGLCLFLPFKANFR